MNDVIPQSFKVQWLNTTLKFIKSDDQMIIKYPEMPVSHVEYLHNLIWQRKNDVGLGFKSLYAPLWEAMKIFSLKYRFKVSVMQSKDADTGQLIIEKILKNTDEENVKVNNKNDLKNHVEDSTHATPKELTTIQMSKSKKTKSEKYFLDKRKIIDSLSPSFIRISLQKILVFIDTEAEASLIFTDLAPIEGRFLENFLGIYNRRNIFQSLLSPACNDILNKMSTGFKKFDKTCKLEVGAIETNAQTKKREVTFLKVPRYVRPTMSRAMLAKVNAEVAQSSTDNQIDDNARCKFLKGLSVNKDINSSISTREITINNETSDVKISVKNNNLDTKIYNNSEISKDIEENNNSINNLTIDKKETNKESYNRKIRLECQEKVKTNNNSPIDNTPIIDEKNIFKKSETISEIGLANERISKTINNSAKDKRILTTDPNKCHKEKDLKRTDNIEEITYKVKALTVDKNAATKSCNSGKETKDISKFLKDPSKKKSSPSKNGIVFEKATGSFDKIDRTQDVIHSQIEKKSKEKLCPRKNKLLEDMSVPVESDKAMRMMQLMGWEGGALGLRGEGITEPIMPILSRSPGAGLGHTSERFVRKQDKIDLCVNVLENILYMVEKNISVSVTPCENQITKKDERFLRTKLHLFNNRLNVSLPKGVESDLVQKILDKMILEPRIVIKLTISTDNKEITLKKIITNQSGTKDTKKKKKSKKSSTITQ